MKGSLPSSHSLPLLEENLKKALTEFLILFLLSEKECFIGELSPEIELRSKGAIHIEFPYSSIYRLCKAGHITESKKRKAPDGRLRQYYKITKQGVFYLQELNDIYHQFIQGVAGIIKEVGDSTE